MRCKANIRYKKFKTMDLTELNCVETWILMCSLSDYAKNPSNHKNDRQLADDMYELMMRKIKEKEPK